MLTTLQNFFLTRAGRIVAVASILAAVGLLAWSWRDNLGPGAAVANDRDRTFIDATTGRTFRAEIHIGEKIPVLSPFTHRHTGYPVAWSWWNKNGQPLTKPEPVLMNSWLGKPGPTFAPLSDRLVLPNEPRPAPGTRPPPTKLEYEKMMKVYNGGN